MPETAAPAHPYGGVLRALRGERTDIAVASQEMDLMRAPGIDGALVCALLDGLGWSPSEYRGFDHLGDNVRSKMLGADPWCWHRELLQSPLQAEFKCVLAADLVLLTAGTDALRKEAEAFLPRSLVLVAQGRNLLRQQRNAEAMATFEKAAAEDPSNGPVFRHAGDAAYQRGTGLMANEWFHMSLHAGSSESFDLKNGLRKDLQRDSQVCLIDYYGSDCLKVGQYFVASRRAQVARYVPPGVRKWLREKLPAGWLTALRTVVHFVSSLSTTVKGLGSGERPYRGKSLLVLSRQLKTLSQTL